MMWWGMWIIGTPVLAASSVTWGWVSIFSPIFTVILLMFLSGMPTAEGDHQKRFMSTVV